MEILQLKYFLDVAQTQHVTQSAERLHVAQPAVTQAIHRLEDELGVPLFDRKGRGIRLSEYGRYFRDRLQPLMDGLDNLPEELRSMAKLENSTIHLNVLAASSLVTDAIANYVHEEEGLNFKMAQAADGQAYDIEVSTHPVYQPRGGEYVCTENIYVAVPVRGKYARRDSLRLEELSEEGFISLQGTSPLRAICDQYCRRAGFKPRVVFESDNPGAVRNLIAANMGVGFWPEFTWGRLNSDRVRLIGITEPQCRRDIVITCRENKLDNTHVRHFYEFLRSYFEARRAEAKGE